MWEMILSVWLVAAAPPPAKPIQVQAEVVEVVDGTVVLRRRVSPAQAQALIRRGAATPGRPSQAAEPGVIVDGHYHFTYPLRPELAERIDVSAGRWTGAPVQLTLERLPTGIYRITALERR